MTFTLDEDSLTLSPTSVSADYTTSGEQYIYVDSSSGPVTVTLASADTVDGREIRILDTGGSASTNTITIATEGTETINPGSNATITLTVDGTYVDLFSDGSNWFSDRSADKGVLSADLVSEVRYAGGPHPDLQTVINNADPDDTVVLVPGSHDISSTVVADKDINLKLLGTLNKTADVVALQCDDEIQLEGRGHRQPVVTSSVADTTAGIIYNKTVTTVGGVFVNGVGGDGHVIQTEVTGDTTNGSKMTLLADGCGGDGVKITRLSGAPNDTMSMLIDVPITINNGSDGVHVAGEAKWNTIRVGTTEGNSGYGFHDENGDESTYHVARSEANTTGGVLFGANSSGNLLTGSILDGITDNGTDNDTPLSTAPSEVIFEGSVDVPSGGSAEGFIADPGVKCSVFYSVADPGADARIEMDRFNDTSVGQQKVRFTETTGAVGGTTTVEYTSRRR